MAPTRNDSADRRRKGSIVESRSTGGFHAERRPEAVVASSVGGWAKNASTTVAVRVMELFGEQRLD